MANALWWVHFDDANNPNSGTRVLSLSSPDLANSKAAHKRARDTAKARLAKRGVKAVNLKSQCVG